MGLDMYFMARKTQSKRATTVPTEIDKFKAYSDSSWQHETVEYEIGYFRKFNALHSHIVETYANGVDDCRPVYLSLNAIEDILDRCNRILKDHSEAPKLLPTQSGFFFGGTEYDEWYFQYVKKAKGLCETILKELPDDYDVIYEASW